MGKKAQAQKEIPPRKNADGSSRAAKPPVTNPQSAAAAVAPTSTVPHRPVAIPTNVPSQGVAEPSVPLSQVVDLLKLANPGVDWGMAMAAMGLAAQNPPVTTIPPTATVPTPTVTSPTPTTENPNQPANKAVEPEVPETAATEKIETPQTVLDVSPISVYEPPTAETKIDELEGGEKDEGEEEGKWETGEGKGEGVGKTDPEKEEEKTGEELDRSDEKDTGNEDDGEDVGDENEREEGKKVEDGVVDEGFEKEKLMSADEFEEIIEGIGEMEGGDGGSLAVDDETERTENPDDVEGRNPSDGEADGGDGLEGEVVPRKEKETEKECKSAKRKLILETEVETEATGQGTRRFSRRVARHGAVKRAGSEPRMDGKTVEISSEDEEEETPLKMRTRAFPTDQEVIAVAEPKEIIHTAAPESVTPVAEENPPNPVVLVEKPVPESEGPEEQAIEEEVEEDEIPEEEPEDEEERYRRERKRKGKQQAKSVKQAQKRPRTTNPNVVIKEPIQVPFRPEVNSEEETSEDELCVMSEE